MSSILEALQKLEEEKARAAEPVDANLDPDTAEDELLGRGRGSGSVTMDLTPMRLLLFAAIFGAFMVVMAIGVALVVSRAAVPGIGGESGYGQRASMGPVVPAVSDAPEAADAPIQTADESSNVAADTAPGETDPETPPPGHPSRYETTTASRSDDARAEGPTPPPRPERGPATVSHEPYIRPEAQRPPDPPRAPEIPAPDRSDNNWTPPSQEATASPPPAQRGPVDPTSLPILSVSEQRRLGLPVIRINFVSEASSTQPRPSALINYNKVYVDEVIPGTSARLIGVTMRGIGIEVNGQRYFISR